MFDSFSLRLRSIAFVVALLSLGLSAYYWWDLSKDYARLRTDTLKQGSQRAMQLANAKASEIDTLLHGVDNVLIQFRERYTAENTGAAEAIANTAFKTFPKDALLHFSIINARGIMEYSTRGVREQVYVGDRDYFQNHQNSQEDKPYINKPIFGRHAGEWIVLLTRPIYKQKRFAGVAAVSLSPEFISNNLAKLHLEPTDVVSLFFQDATYLSRSHRLMDVLGKTVPQNLPMFLDTAAKQGVFSSVSVADGVPRIYAWFKLDDYPLVIAVGLDESAILASVEAAIETSRRNNTFGIAIIVLLCTLISYFIQRTAINSKALLAKDRQLQEALSVNDEIMEASTTGIAAYRQDGQCVMANPAFADTVGGTRQQLLSQNFRKVPSWQLSGLLDAADKALASNEKVDHQIQATTTFGRSVWLQCQLSLCIIQGEKHLLLMIQDITDEQKAREELRLAASVFHSSAEGVVITDTNGTILSANPAFTEITGYPVEEAIGQNPSILRSDHNSPEFYQEMWASLKQKGQWRGEIWNRRKDGEAYLEWLAINRIDDSAGHPVRYVAIFHDITEMRRKDEHIRQLAFYDPLTELPNRRLLIDRLQMALTTTARSGEKGATIFIDLDNFKELNDSLGHDYGDLLLQKVAARLGDCVRGGDTVARLGGDEFVVMLNNLGTSTEEAATKADAISAKILASLNAPYQLNSHYHHSTPSIGVTLFGEKGDSLEEVLKRADLAMYQAKTAGRNTIRFFDPQMRAAAVARSALETSLYDGMWKGQLMLYYQPQVDTEGRCIGAEALARWRHPIRGMVAPAEFIPIAESTGLILPLGHILLENACYQLAAWATQPASAHLTLAVNISARQLLHPDFEGLLTAMLQHTGASPRQLKLELTESLLLDNVEAVIAKMTALKNLGVSFSIDDFGTGYSSLSYLKLLPLDQLKIDQSFVRDMLTDPNDAAIIRTIIALAQSLGLSVIAEGVETEEQRLSLADLGCFRYQGYLFGKPLPIEDFDRMPGLASRSLPNQPEAFPAS